MQSNTIFEIANAIVLWLQCFREKFVIPSGPGDSRVGSFLIIFHTSFGEKCNEFAGVGSISMLAAVFMTRVTVGGMKSAVWNCSSIMFANSSVWTMLRNVYCLFYRARVVRRVCNAVSFCLLCRNLVWLWVCPLKVQESSTTCTRNLNIACL